MARILVVDDDTAVQATVRLLLERAGHSVVTAGDGRKGIALFEAGDFDLLFLDIFMPGMDGFETMRLVHQREAANSDHRDLRQADPGRIPARTSSPWR